MNVDDELWTIHEERSSMSMKLRASSGTYNVRASELARDKTIKTVKCVVHFLDDTEASFEIDKRGRAQILLDKVFDHLELVEKDYFGLQFADVAPAPDAMLYALHPSPSDLMRWMDPLKTLKKQIRVGPPFILYFRVKFYVSDPSRLQEEYTRYHFFLQMKKDILEGRLVVPYKTAVLLASYAVQSELGDFNPEEHTPGYLSEFRFIPGQSEDFEKEVAELHKSHRSARMKGQTPADAEFNYLDRAKRLDMYGVDLHSARDQSNMEIQLGVTSAGLVVFQNSVRVNTFSWAKIVKISFKRKQFFIQLRRETNSRVGDSTRQLNMNDSVENLIGFNMVSYRSCKNLWKSCVEHHTFFRLHTPKAPTKRYFFSLGSKFSGRTEYQTQEESKRRARVERSFARSPSKRYARRTVGGTTREIIMEERNAIDGYRNAPHNAVDTYRHSDGYIRNNTSPQKPPRTNNMPNSTSYPNSLTRTSYNDFNHSSVRATLPNDYRGRKAWSDQRLSDDEGGFLTYSQSQDSKDSFAPAVPPKMMGYIEDNSSQSEQTYELPVYNDTYLPNGGTPYQDGHGLVSIRMKPDAQGRFGFNVKSLMLNKGGADQGMPIIVSRVAPNTPADLCIPRLNEGDQVLFINGRDVSQHTHEQVVMFIRASRETHSGELVLVVRPNVYIGEDTAEEPDFQYIPDTHHITTTLPQGQDPLAGSLLMLRESLDNGAAITQFEQLYRKKPSMTMNAARLSDNIPKNRYRDISPYDQTRVLLKTESAAGDYINANYVNMEIPGSGIVNRYVAAQGPLPNTCTDFWQMIWEQQSRLVIMLTTKVERGRVKCHQYWPDLYETIDFGAMQVTCVKEEQTQSFAFREFTLVHSGSSEERHIQQMQYLAWPDHGVPDDSKDFLDFVVRVRQNRVGMVEPTVVHCSAGIGRTGVLVTMETAMCLIEANQPIYPLDIVRQMRDQRAMLIQTTNQYKFVCEAILRVYHERIVQPLEDYQR